MTEAAAARTEHPPVLRRIARLLAPYKAKMLLVAAAVVRRRAATLGRPVPDQGRLRRRAVPGRRRRRGPRLLGWLVAGLCVIPVVTALIGIGQNC